MAKSRIPCPTALRLLIAYNPDTGSLKWRRRSKKWFKPKGGRQTASGCAKRWNGLYAGSAAMNSVTGKGYLGGPILGTNVKAHQVAWSIHYGERPKLHIDHINGNRTDNRIANLRLATAQQNAMNRSGWRNAASSYRGVYPMPNKRWRARINDFEGNTLSLGVYSTEREAAMAYNEAARHIHGEWAKLNAFK